ncbi:unnamed protein product [Caenorhabditis brenneri]
MHNTNYRKYNVDDFDPAQFYDHHEEELTPSSGPDESLVRQYLESNQLLEALKSALLSPPNVHSEQNIKTRSTLLVTQVLHLFKSSDIEGAVQKLSIDEGDILMKYIYKGMQMCSDAPSCQSLLQWHCQLVAKFGYGAIVRVMTDRQRF